MVHDKQPIFALNIIKKNGFIVTGAGDQSLNFSHLSYKCNADEVCILPTIGQSNDKISKLTENTLSNAEKTTDSWILDKYCSVDLPVVGIYVFNVLRIKAELQR